MTEYTAATDAETAEITATPSDESYTVTIASDDATIAEGTATWAEGENVVTITVSAEGEEDTVYTVTVTYTPEAEPDEVIPEG